MGLAVWLSVSYQKSMKTSLLKCAAAEFVGTFLLVFIGVGSMVAASDDLGLLSCDCASAWVLPQ